MVCEFERLRLRVPEQRCARVATKQLKKWQDRKQLKSRQNDPDFHTRARRSLVGREGDATSTMMLSVEHILRHHPGAQWETQAIDS